MKKTVLTTLKIVSNCKEILENKNISIEEKDGISNFVTTVDSELEKYFQLELKKAFPDSQIISEESANQINSSNSELKFVVDPLDGTTNFTNGWPHVVSIGIVKNNDLIGGVIYDVLSKNIYFSSKGDGVYICSIHDIQNYKKIITPKYQKEIIKKAVIGFDNTYGKEAFEITKNIMSKLYYAGASLKIVAPMALDLLKVALGKENRPTDYYDAIWHTEVRSWDLCAATAMLRELGGEIIEIDGNPLSIDKLTSPNDKIFFIASGNKVLLKNIHKLIV